VPAHSRCSSQGYVGASLQGITITHMTSHFTSSFQGISDKTVTSSKAGARHARIRLPSHSYGSFLSDCRSRVHIDGDSIYVLVSAVPHSQLSHCRMGLRLGASTVLAIRTRIRVSRVTETRVRVGLQLGAACQRSFMSVHPSKVDGMRDEAPCR